MEPRPGEIVARKYHILRVLGRGAMGMVVAARHLHLDQAVALKFMLPAARVARGATERFLDEARAASRLRSPPVVAVRDADVLDDGTPYIAMELLEGDDLAGELRRRGPLPVAEAAGLALQLCRALADAHAQGIVHRDIKPANLFAARLADGSVQLKVLDFGISTLGPGAREAGGAPRGSPLYMSPEQVRAAPGVDARSDLWAAGVVLYQLLSGRLPFDGADETDIGVHILNDAPAPLRAAGSRIPAGLERVVLRCLAKRPCDRYADAGALAAALEPFALTRRAARSSGAHGAACRRGGARPTSGWGASGGAASGGAGRARSARRAWRGRRRGSASGRGSPG
jgi:serine/threonine-protein kinase